MVTSKLHFVLSLKERMIKMSQNLFLTIFSTWHLSVVPPKQSLGGTLLPLLSNKNKANYKKKELKRLALDKG